MAVSHVGEQPESFATLEDAPRERGSMTQTYTKRTRIEAPALEVFAWHARPGAFERLTPPWAPVEVVDRTGGIEDGARVVLRLPIGPLRLRWLVEHGGFQAGRQFRDVQLTGPFAHWEHTHRFHPAGAAACDLEDHVEYRLPLGPLGHLLAGTLSQRRLARLFDYRHRITAHDIAAHRRSGVVPMRVLVSGASGLIGSALVPFLTTGGHGVTRLKRAHPVRGGNGVGWDPATGVIDTAGLEGHDAVVHLAGEHVATRWTAVKQARIRESRVKGTRLLCEALGRLARPPEVLVCASAVGYYGDRGDEILGEDSGPGTGFLAGVCQAWEAATEPAVKQGIRVVHLRLGVVLSPAGGALRLMLPPFRAGLGGRLGSGQQYMSWIAVDDAVGAIHYALTTAALSGPVNAVAPYPVTNRQAINTLGHVLHRPTPVPLAACTARVVFGEMADQMLLSSARVEPRRLLATGYRFRYPTLEGALRHLLGR
jgi:uncharacterized protein